MGNKKLFSILNHLFHPFNSLLQLMTGFSRSLLLYQAHECKQMSKLGTCNTGVLFIQAKALHRDIPVSLGAMDMFLTLTANVLTWFLHRRMTWHWKWDVNPFWRGDRKYLQCPGSAVKMSGASHICTSAFHHLGDGHLLIFPFYIQNRGGKRRSTSHYQSPVPCCILARTYLVHYWHWCSQSSVLPVAYFTHPPPVMSSEARMESVIFTK